LSSDGGLVPSNEDLVLPDLAELLTDQPVVLPLREDSRMNTSTPSGPWKVTRSLESGMKDSNTMSGSNSATAPPNLPCSHSA